jgi:hypothetical protein
VAALAPAYLPRRPTETVLYALVRQNLETFVAHAREHYDGGLPRYVEAELRAYLPAFYPATPPTVADLDAVVARTACRSIDWLHKRGFLDESPLEARSGEPPAGGRVSYRLKYVDRGRRGKHRGSSSWPGSRRSSLHHGIPW